jgi:hypothetical protein
MNGYQISAVWIYKDSKILNVNEKKGEMLTVNLILISK